MTGCGDKRIYPQFLESDSLNLLLSDDRVVDSPVGLITCARFWIRKTVTSKASWRSVLRTCEPVSEGEAENSENEVNVLGVLCMSWDMARNNRWNEYLLTPTSWFVFVVVSPCFFLSLFFFLLCVPWFWFIDSSRPVFFLSRLVLSCGCFIFVGLLSTCSQRQNAHCSVKKNGVTHQCKLQQWKRSRTWTQNETLGASGDHD